MKEVPWLRPRHKLYKMVMRVSHLEFPNIYGCKYEPCRCLIQMGTVGGGNLLMWNEHIGTFTYCL